MTPAPMPDRPALAAPVIADDAPSEQLRVQAVQLAAYLRGRQKELDHREAELNSPALRTWNRRTGHKLVSPQPQSDSPRGGPEPKQRTDAETLERQWQQFRQAMADIEQKHHAVARVQRKWTRAGPNWNGFAANC